MNQLSQNSPTDSILPGAPPSVGPEDGYPTRGLAVLHPEVEFMRFCSQCQQETRFIAQIEMLNGLWGCCANCGDERVVPYTRTVDAA